MTEASEASKDSYNQLLFEGNRIRRFLHMRRFHWMQSRLRHLRGSTVNVIEIGCHDAKTIMFVEQAGLEVRRYVGLDPNPTAIEAARRRWKNRPSVDIRMGSSAADLGLETGAFDIGVCMETLEHLPDATVEAYLCALSRAVSGMVFITVPIERGAILLVKQIGYRAFNMYGERLSVVELANGVMGRMHRIPRHEHKGFDERSMLRRVQRYFEVVEAAGLFVPLLTTFNFTFGIVGKSREPRSHSTGPESRINE
jgi:hypothetical protein